MSIFKLLRLIAWFVYTLLTAQPNGITPPPAENEDEKEVTK